MKPSGTIPAFAGEVDDAKKLSESLCKRGGFVTERGRVPVLLTEGDMRLESEFS